MKRRINEENEMKTSNQVNKPRETASLSHPWKRKRAINLQGCKICKK